MNWKDKKQVSKYQKEYQMINKKRILQKRKERYKKTHITIAEKRECYITGDYEKALEELKIKKGIKENVKQKGNNRRGIKRPSHN